MSIVRLYKRIALLIRQGDYGTAEKLLLQEYCLATQKNRTEALEDILLLLAQLYVVTRQYKAAEERYLERERISPASIAAKTSTATFYFWGIRRPGKALAKLNEIRIRENGRGFRSNIDSWYRALNLKGRVLLALGRKRAACVLLEELVKLVQDHFRAIETPELELIEEMSERKLAAPLCHKYLRLIEAKIRSRDYKRRASELLVQLGSG